MPPGFVNLNGKRLRLAQGKANKKLAEIKFHGLMLELGAESGRPAVVSVIEAFLAHAERHHEARSYEERRSILRRFAEVDFPTNGGRRRVHKKGPQARDARLTFFAQG